MLCAPGATQPQLLQVPGLDCLLEVPPAAWNASGSKMNTHTHTHV